MRFHRPLAIALALVAPGGARAATSSRSVPSPLGMSAHNVTFDGRLFIGRGANEWDARVLRPERVVLKDGFPDVTSAFSPAVLVDANSDMSKNALALCEETPQPYRCTADGTASGGGADDCYDLVVIYSPADPNQATMLDAPIPTMERRRLLVVVGDPRTASAGVTHVEWRSAAEPLIATLSGIEPSVTQDGHLLVWNGISKTEDGVLLYSVNDTPCGADGWQAPRSIGAMATDPRVAGHYPLGEKPLHAADGSIFGPTDPVPGAYPWVFPDGEAVNFTATNMPCKAADVPHGCGPRRNALSVLGYPTNWTLAHIDGDLNPDTEDVVRLFFTSPGQHSAMPLPATRGQDVWPFFGGNTENYGEIIFDDGLDGNYAGLWHMNELVDRYGDLDGTATADSSGYFNTARQVLPAPARNLLGGVASFDGKSAGRDLPDDPSLSPTGRLTIDFLVRPDAEPDCDANGNWRVLLSKEPWAAGGTFSVVYEEGRWLHVRVRAVGQANDYELWTNRQVPLGAWSRVVFTYDAATGLLEAFINGRPAGTSQNPPGEVVDSTGPLRVGGPGTTPAACPNGLGGFPGAIDQLDVSNRPWVQGVTFPPHNNGILGKAADFDGVNGYLTVAHAASLTPVNAISMELALKPVADPDCDAKANFRILLEKGPDYSLLLEDNRSLTARVRVAGGTVYDLNTGATVPVGSWSRVAATYSADSGTMKLYIDGALVQQKAFAPALLEGTTAPLTIGGSAVSPGACPSSDGRFQGSLDEVAVSRIARDFAPPPSPPDAGVSAPPPPDAGTAQASGGGGCAVGGRGAGATLALLVTFLAAAAARRRRRS
jgi:hypothetical protein